MRTYIISVAAAAVIAAVVNMIAPEKWTKYVGMATGLVVVMCIAQPVFTLFHEDVFEGFRAEAQVSEADGDILLRSEIKAELERRVEEDAAARLRSEFNRECTVDAEIAVNSAGEIEGVESLRVYGKKIDSAALARLREVYGVSEVTYEGYRENIKKPE